MMSQSRSAGILHNAYPSVSYQGLNSNPKSNYTHLDQVSPKSSSDPFPLTTLKHSTPLKSLTGNKCFVCCELLDNKLNGEIIITLQCNKTIHEQCFIELISDLPLSPGNYEELPGCFCNDHCHEKFIPKDLVYLNKLIVTLSKTRKSQDQLATLAPTSGTPKLTTSNSVDSNTPNTPNIIKLSPTLIKKPPRTPPVKAPASPKFESPNQDIESNQLPNGESDLGSGNTYPSAHTSLNSDDPINEKLKSFGLIEDDDISFGRKPSRLSLTNHTLSKYDSIDSDGPLSSTFAKYINSPLENETDGLLKPLSNDGSIVSSTSLRFNLNENDSNIKMKKVKRKLSKTFNKLIHQPDEPKKGHHKRTSSMAPIELEVNSCFNTPRKSSRSPDQLTSLSDNETDTPASTLKVDSQVEAKPNQPFLQYSQKANDNITDIAPNSAIANFRESNFETTTFPYSAPGIVDNKSILSSNTLVFTVDSTTPQILKNKSMPLDTLKNQYIEELMYNNDCISFTKLIKFGELRLVDRLIISLDELNWYSSMIYLFDECLLIPIGDESIEINMDEISFSLRSPAVVKLTDNSNQLVLLKAHDLPIIEKWVIAITDRNYKFPLGLISSTAESMRNYQPYGDSYSIYYQEEQNSNSIEEWDTGSTGTIQRSEIKITDEASADIENIEGALLIDSDSESDLDSDNELITSIMKALDESNF